MTRRSEIEQHLSSLQEISNIMGSMKTLALSETRKLARFLATQQRVVNNIKVAAADFRHFYYSWPSPLSKDSRHIYLLIGSERGLCGDFNEKIVKTLKKALEAHPPTSPRLIVVGHKLCLKLERDARTIALLEGANVAEEVENVLSHLIESLGKFREPGVPPPITVVHHSANQNHPSEQGTEQPSSQQRDNRSQGVQMTPLLPPFQETLPSIQFAHPPLLNLSPPTFFAELLDHYLFAVLHEICYTSLMAENRRRMQHLEGAINHLEEKITNLALKRNALRQEEIIEEIEVILLSAETMIPGSSPLT